jgi:hypothetical protein
MKKIITTFLFSFLAAMCVAQNDTLLWETFDVDPVGNPNINFQNQVQPSGTITNDPAWYNWDNDGLPDQSTAGGRPGEWFWQSGGFADVDTNDGCMASNSWTNDPNTPVENFLITPALDIVDANAVVHWLSATFQTPRYLDGYQILVSTTNNDVNSFTDTIFRAAEMTGWINQPNDPPDSSFASFFFGPAGTYIQGINGTDVQYGTDSLHLLGIQTAHSANLAAYSGQTIYVAFEHYTHDDNLLSLDDIVVTGTNPIGFDELTRDPLKMYAYPNPANRNTTLNFTLGTASNVTVKVTDILGNVMLKRQMAGATGKNLLAVDTEKFSAGTYFYTVTSGTTTSTGKFSVIR